MAQVFQAECVGEGEQNVLECGSKTARDMVGLFQTVLRRNLLAASELGVAERASRC